MAKEKKPFVRGNESLKAPFASEFVSQEEYQKRIEEVIHCRNDIVYFAEKYFTIISKDPKIGKHIIHLYPRQKELVKTMVNNDRVIIVSSRQIGKTTAYTIFALWYTIFNNDIKILICANKESTSLEIVSRVRLAYELLPNWLKPGIVGWNKGTLELSNGSSVSGTSTSPETARGSACNCIDINSRIILKDRCGMIYEPLISHTRHLIYKYN